MRIATWNIGGGFIKSDKDIYETEEVGYFIEELQKIQPDIACFQEVHISLHTNQCELIAKALGFDFFVVETIADSHIQNDQKLGIGIISKYPIVSSKFHTLPNPNLQFIRNGKKAFSHDKGFLESKILYNGSEIRVLSGHMVPFHRFKKDFLDDEFTVIRNQCEEIISAEKMPTLIGADMNFENMEVLLPEIFVQKFIQTLDSEATTPDGKRYDKILLSLDWKCLESRVIVGNADHYLCIADVDLIG